MTSILKVDTIQDTAGNNIINESGDTITIGASGDTVNVVGTLQNNGSGLVSGITEADQWRISANHTITFSGEFVTANWERVDTDGFDYIGTGMTQSSGEFTFPSTGYYLIILNANFLFNTQENATFKLETTINNSTYSEAARSGEASASGYFGNASSSFIFDVTSTANCKVKFSTACGSSGNQTLNGNTDFNNTHVTFIKLGET
jgi:hypothetical protein